MLKKYAHWILLILAIPLAVKGVTRSLSAMAPDQIYNRDFVTVYLMGKCVWTGDDPSRPLRSLARDHLNVELPPDWRDDPGVLPPPAGVIVAPAALFPFKTAALLWWMLDIFWLFCSLFLILKNTDFRLTKLKFITLFLLLLGLPPVFLNLYIGQLVLVILFLVAASLRMAKLQRHWLAGALLGATLLLKFLTWPIFLAPLFTKNWRALTAATITVCSGYALSILVFGFDTAVAFFTGIPSLGADLLRDPTNFSIIAAVHRIFSGTITWGESAMSAPALFPFANLAKPVSIGLQLATIILAAWFLRKRRNFYEWGGVLICATLLLGPVTRDHYFILAIIPATEVVFGMKRTNYTVADLALLLISCLLLCIPHYRLIQLGRGIAGLQPHPSGVFELPFWPAAVTMLPVAGLLILTFLTYRYSKKLYETRPGPVEI